MSWDRATPDRATPDRATPIRDGDVADEIGIGSRNPAVLRIGWVNRQSVQHFAAGSLGKV